MNGISFYVEKNTVFGILGENGAGKTTTLEMIEGLRKPNKGEIKILGHNALKDSQKLKKRLACNYNQALIINF